MEDLRVVVVEVNFKSAADPLLSRINYCIPQFFDGSGKPHEVENIYLRSISIRLSCKSVKTVTEQLKEFLVWRTSSGVELVDVTESDLKYYVSAQCSYLKKDGKQLAWNTVRARAGGVYRFIRWCHRKNLPSGIVKFEISRREIDINSDFKQLARNGRPSDDGVKFLVMADALRFIDAIAEVSGERSHIRQRNTLIARLMLQCGLRLAEAVNFPIDDLPAISAMGHMTPARVIGKGNKARMIIIPNRLLADLWNYADVYREKILETDVQDIEKHVSRNLFLREDGAGLTGNWIEIIFARAGRAIGIKAVPHALRHTFASYHYLLNKDIVNLSKLLGHADETTTQKYYVHVANLISYAQDYETLQLEIDKLCICT
ncbi:tyrosine-type recombinase/integrase [Pseudomonas putida]|uniref:tyrosine-type recombinase/integrase n=1 Tax=Pseudomonas putida TaxID=303 RepID=UPI0002D8F412|nr:site-specific integrase [Pseudomonas putida]